MKTINFNDCIGFIKKAIDRELVIDACDYRDTNPWCWFCIYYYESTIKFSFELTKNYFAILGQENSLLKIPYTYSERDKLTLDNLILDVREMNEQKAINQFNHFFNDTHNLTDKENDE